VFALPGASQDVLVTSAILDPLVGALHPDGALNLSGILSNDFLFGDPPPAGAILFSFGLALAPDATIGDHSLTFLMVGDAGGETEFSDEVTARFTVAAVTEIPEPSTWALMLAGLAGLGFMARRRHA
jgi:hypothetical protein